MRVFFALLTGTLVACTSDDPSQTRTDDDFEPPIVMDTGWPPGDLGAVHLAHVVNDDTLRVYGVFADSAPSFVNLARCAITGGMCISSFPRNEDEWEDLDPDLEAERETVPTKFAGYEITLGDYVLPYREDLETGFGFYTYDASGTEPPQGWLGASFGGQLESYEGDEAMYVPAPFELQKPLPDDHILFTNNELVPFEWVPTGEGFVTLAVFTRFTLAGHYLVEDDGYFELDVDSLGLTGTTESLTFQFTRWSETELNYKGHAIQFLATSEAYFTGDYVLIGNATYTTTPDACSEAEGRAPLQAGEYWGWLGGPVNEDYDPANAPGGCLLGGDLANALGRDGLFRVDVLPKHVVGFDFNTFDESASVYISTNCNNMEGSCIIGNDVSPDPNVSEFVQYFNPDDEVRTVFVGLDTTEPGETIYTLAMSDEELTEPVMYDDCADAQLGAPITPASYYAEFTGYTDGLNPGVGGCTASSLGGADAMTPITLQSYQTLTLNVSMPDGDPAIYLLYNCLNTISCPVGADVSIGQNEELQYQNTSAATENLYIVVDSKEGLRPYFLSIDVY